MEWGWFFIHRYNIWQSLASAIYTIGYSWRMLMMIHLTIKYLGDMPSQSASSDTSVKKTQRWSLKSVSCRRLKFISLISYKNISVDCWIQVWYKSYGNDQLRQHSELRSSLLIELLHSMAYYTLSSQSHKSHAKTMPHPTYQWINTTFWHAWIESIRSDMAAGLEPPQETGTL